MVEALDCRRHVRTWPESTPPQNNHTYQPCSALQPIHGPPVWILSQRFLVLGLLLWFSFVVVWSIFKRVASEWGKLFFIMWMASSNQLIEGLKRKKNGGSPRKKKKKQLPPNCCWTWAMASVLPWVPSLLGCPGDTGCANCHHKANSGRRMGRLINSSYGRDWRQTHRWGLDVYMNVHMYVFTFSIDCSFSWRAWLSETNIGTCMKFSTKQGTWVLFSSNFKCTMSTAHLTGKVFKVLLRTTQLYSSLFWIGCFLPDPGIFSNLSLSQAKI